AVSFLWHFPAGFPGSDFPTTPPYGVRTFLEGRFSLRPPRLHSQRLKGYAHAVCPHTPFESGENGVATETATAVADALHGSAADRTVRRTGGQDALPYLGNPLIQGEPPAAWGCTRANPSDG